MTHNPYQGNPYNYTGHLFFTGPGYTQPLPAAPAPSPVPTTPTGGLADPTGGTGGTGSGGGLGIGGPNDPGSMRDAKSDKGFLEGLGTFGLNALGMTNPIGAMLGAMKGSFDPMNPNLSITRAAIDAIAGGNINGAFDAPGFSPEGMAAMGFSRDNDSAHGYDGESDPSFSDWGGSVGVGWGGSPDGFSGMDSGQGDGGGGAGGEGGASGPDGEGSAGFRRGGLAGYAHGGMADPYVSEGGLAMMARGRQVNGPGGGQDDLVPAMLSTDEYVIPADVVAHLGDGNPRQGGLKIDQLVRNVRKHKTVNGGGHPPMAKSINRYMQKVRK